jgi:hypothetical protein
MKSLGGKERALPALPKRTTASGLIVTIGNPNLLRQEEG